MLFELNELRSKLSGRNPLQCEQLGLEFLVLVALNFEHYFVQFLEHIVHNSTHHLVPHLRKCVKHFEVVELFEDLLLHAILKVLEGLFQPEVVIFIPQDLSYKPDLLQSNNKPLH